MAKKDVELRFSLKDGVSAGLKSIQGAVGGIATSIAKVGPAAVAAGAALATVGIGAALTQGVQDAAAFEQQLARIGATAGLTAEELGQVKAAIEGAAAGSTATISETAAAFQTLAAEGLSASEAIAALPNTLALATAAQISTQEAAGALAATLDQFGLSADQAAKSADVIATAALQGGTGVNQLLQAFEQVGPVARNAGLSLEETAAAVALLAQNGIEGGKAGGALRAILDGLADPASRLSVELSKIGISSRDFTTVIEQLGAKGEAASGAINALGSRGTAALQALLREGGGSVDELAAKLQGSEGAVQSLADKIENTLAGSFDNLRQAFADVQAKFFEPLLGPIKAEVDALEAQIRAFAASPEFAKLRKAFGSAFAAGITAIKEFIAEFNFDEALAKLQTFLTESKARLDDFAESAATVADAVKGIGEAVGLVANVFDAGVSTIAGAGSKLAQLSTGPLSLVSDKVAELGQMFGDIADNAMARATEQARQAGDNFNALASAVGGATPEVQAQAQAAERGADANRELGAAAQEGAAAVAAGTGELQNAAQATTTVTTTIKNAAAEVAALQAEIKAAQQGLANAILSGADPAAIETFKARIDSAKQQLQLLALAGVDVGDKTAAGANKAAASLDQIGSSASQAASEVESVGDATKQSASQAAEGTASLSGITAALFAKYSSLSEAAGKFFAETQKAANVGSLSLQDYGNAIAAADIATQRAFDSQVAGANAAIAKLQEFAETGQVAGDVTAAAFLGSEESLDAMQAAIDQGIGGFELLDRQTLSGLQSAIDAARNKTKQLAAEARAAVTELNAIGDQLQEQALRDSGNEAELAKLELDRKINNIEQIEKRAGAAGAAGAARAKQLAQEEYQRKIAAIDAANAAQAAADRANADARIEQNQRVWDNDPYNPNNTAPAPTQQQGPRTTAGRSSSGAVSGKGSNVALNINVDRLQSVGGNRRDIEELVRLLKPELDRLIARTR